MPLSDDDAATLIFDAFRMLIAAREAAAMPRHAPMLSP